MADFSPLFGFGILQELNEVSTAFRILLALIIGGVIGLERGRHGRAAGLRTHVLVCVGASIAAMTGIYMSTSLQNGDPTRIASNVVSGIGFLGAGMIIVKNNATVTGLTIAAALWATAAVGLSVGAGFYVCAVIGTAVIFLTTALLTVFEAKQKLDHRFYIEIDDITAVNDVVAKIKSDFMYAHSFDITSAKSGISGHIGIMVNINTGTDKDDSMIARLMEIDHTLLAIEE